MEELCQLIETVQISYNIKRFSNCFMLYSSEKFTLHVHHSLHCWGYFIVSSSDDFSASSKRIPLELLG